MLGIEVEVRPQLFYDFLRFRGDGEVLQARPLLFLDPPQHQRIRRLVTGAFTRSAVERWRPRIRALTAELVDAAGPVLGNYLLELISEKRSPAEDLLSALIAPDDAGALRPARSGRGAYAPC